VGRKVRDKIKSQLKTGRVTQTRKKVGKTRWNTQKR
jgi:hypothetical protein